MYATDVMDPFTYTLSCLVNARVDAGLHRLHGECSGRPYVKGVFSYNCEGESANDHLQTCKTNSY